MSYQFYNWVSGGTVGPVYAVNTIKEALIEAARRGDDLSYASITGTSSSAFEDITNADLKELKIPNSYILSCRFNGSDLTNANLSNINLHALNDFIGCTFVKTKFDNSSIGYNFHISGSNFTNATFESSTFYSPTFENCNLTNVSFLNTNFWSGGDRINSLARFYNETKLINTNFSGINLRSCSFIDCDLSRSNFSNTKAIVNFDDSGQLSIYVGKNYEKIFQRCNLTNVNFSDADLTGQVLTGNNLTYCNFTEAILFQTTLTNIVSGSNCNFTRTDLQYSNLSNSNFSSSYLKECNFSDVILSGTNFSNCNLQKSYFKKIEYFKYVNFTNADLTKAIFLTSDISTFILKDSNLSKVILSGCTFSSSNNRELEKAEYDLAVVTEKLEADTITLQTISATIADPLQVEIDASITEANAKTNCETGLSGLSDIIAQLKIDYSIPLPAFVSQFFNCYTITEINDLCKYLDTYASQKRSWDDIKIIRTFELKPGPSEAEGEDWARRGLWGETWYVLAYPPFFESYYILSLQIYNPINGLKKIYNDSINAHDLAIKELQPLSGPYNTAVEVVYADTLLVNEYQTKVNELSAADTIISYANLDGVNLTQSNLTNRDLTLCSLKGTIFSDTILTNVNFTSATLYNDDLSGIILRGCKFIYSNLSGCNFSNIIDMNGLDFTNADLRESNFTNSKFDGSIFDYANMTGSIIKAIDSFSGTPLSGFSTLTNVSFNGTILNDVILTKADFTGNTNLKGISLTGSDLTGSKLAGVNMSGATLTNAVFNSISATSADFTSANMIRIDLSESLITNSVFTSANMSRSYIQAANITLSNFDYTNISGADLTESTISHSRFWGSVLPYADLRNSKFKSNNFSYADLSHVKTFKDDFYYNVFTGAKLSFLDLQKLNIFKVS